MNNLIKAFSIFNAYMDTEWPTSCEHDVMYVHCDPEIVSTKDIADLEELGFTADFRERHFYSFKYGSA